MVDVNPFELHPEEVAKVDNYSEDFKNFVNASEKNMLGMMADTESVIESMIKTRLDPEGYSSDLAPWEKRLVEDGVGISGSSLPTNDPVNHPSHYTHYKGVEVIQLTEQMNFNRGNAVKYIARAGIKDQSKEIEDLEKAKWYIQREIDRLKEED